MKHPFHQIHLYEIGSRLFCGKKGKPLHNLLNEMQEKTPFGWADEIWLMGIWKNSPSSKKIAETMPTLRPGYESVKSKIEPGDVYGSPYAIYEYKPDPIITEKDNLTEIYEWFQSKNKKLILDFVPNHMAIDSPMVSSNPNSFLLANDTLEIKNTFVHPNGNRYFYGKDPYFDGWTDTIQWDFSNPEVEDLQMNILLDIAKQCDGVRCDMAMLPLPDVFEMTHGRRSVFRWEKVIRTIKEEFPHFKFYAEVYWGLESRLLALGFDATYDKQLYDFFLHQNLGGAMDRLQKQSNLGQIRFLENHDEERAKHCFGDRGKTYFSLLSAYPNTILFYDGQELGLSKKIPVQMIRTDEEPIHFDTYSYYERALSVIQKRSKEMDYIDVPYSEFNNQSIFCRLLISENQRELFIWNPNDHICSGWIPYQNEIIYQKELKDIVSGNVFSQEKKEDGMYYLLNPNELQWFTF
ncbi:alpha amylase, catalytic domain protein [Leptospira yanagawae serovar Saopaulo str. Sao Paulo = ATCC 700523]|uniref:Alpha amylase, catalytic domain protein n=2 Tax=Leptospira yanagawae TaxID=293069 RepID=A0A5E8HA10_9LEPT|nr:alpha amylase, catalytic domain protein [Leptospira yanagawae serovar Saopaulo str. Sao Paulo = ATCC 700523]